MGHHTLIVEQPHRGVELALSTQNGVMALHILEGEAAVLATYSFLVSV